MSKSPDWTGWQALLAGKQHEWDHRAHVLDGFWRKGDDAIATWHDAEGLWVKVNGNRPFRPKHGEDAYAESEFGFIVKRPISHALYTAVIGGAPWPDQPEDVRGKMGDNLPEDPAERFKLELEAEKEAIERFRKEPITSEDAATKCGLWAGKIAELAKAIDAKRVELKKPHDDAGKAVQAVYKPLVDTAENLSTSLKKHMAAWVLEKKRKADEEERQRREAERKAAEELEVPPPPPRADNRPKSSVVTGGVTVRTRKVAKVTDLVKAATHFASKPTPNLELVDLIHRLAYRDLAAGNVVPGAEMVDDVKVS